MSMFGTNDKDDLFWDMKQFAKEYSFETLLQLVTAVLKYTDADEIRIRTEEEYHDAEQ